MKDGRPRLRVFNTENWEEFDLDIRPVKRGRRTISMVYGPNWVAIPAAAYAALAREGVLRGEDYRVFYFLLGQVEPGNHIRLRNVDVAKEMGMSPGNVARAIGRLKEHGIILDREGTFGWRLHPEYGFRGDPTGKVAKRKDGSLVLVS